MALTLSDSDIEALLSESKELPGDYLKLHQLIKKRGHKQRDLGVVGAAGSPFRLIIRQSDFNPLDFSVVLAHDVKGSNQRIILRRYNGNSHAHTNKLESKTFKGFHIHMATQRYMELGGDDEGYAEPTDRYADLAGAIDCMIRECGFKIPKTAQRKITEGF